MDIRENKSYFLKSQLPAYEFGADKQYKGLTLKRKEGVFYIGEENDQFYFQSVLPCFIDGVQSSVYVVISKDELDNSLEEFL